MRYKVVVTRVQVAERIVRAPSEEKAGAKVQEEFERPYGYFGSWKTTTSEIDVIEPEEMTVIGSTHLATGPLLLSIKDAANALGISCSTLYQMMTQGDIEWGCDWVEGVRCPRESDGLHPRRAPHEGCYVCAVALVSIVGGARMTNHLSQSQCLATLGMLLPPGVKQSDELVQSRERLAEQASAAGDESAFQIGRQLNGKRWGIGHEHERLTSNASLCWRPTSAKGYAAASLPQRPADAQVGGHSDAFS